MRNILTIVEIVIAVLLISFVLLQAKGTGFGTGFQTSGQSYTTRRGLERIVFVATLIFTTLFALVSILLLLV